MHILSLRLNNTSQKNNCCKTVHKILLQNVSDYSISSSTIKSIITGVIN
jgi:hypothetical protein